jgi:hypothetical protein
MRGEEESMVGIISLDFSREGVSGARFPANFSDINATFHVTLFLNTVLKVISSISPTALCETITDHNSSVEEDENRESVDDLFQL